MKVQGLHVGARGRPRAAVVCALAAALLFTGSARGSDGELSRGIRAYEQGDLGVAEPALRHAAAHAKTKSERARAWLTLGLLESVRAKTDKARTAFEHALADDPDIDVERDRVPPKVVSLFDQVRRATVGELRVEAPEAAAKVFVGNEARGEAPLRLRLRMGTYDLRVLSADEERSFEAPRVAITGQPTRIYARLEPRRRALATTTPPWFRKKRTWAFVTLGISAATLTSGLLVGHWANQASAELRLSESKGTLGYSRYLDLAGSAQSRARAANVLLVVGGATAVTSLVLFVVDARERPPEVHAGWSVDVSPTTLTLSRRF